MLFEIFFGSCFLLFEIFLKSTIQHITRPNINTTKWDQCITTASNGLVYAYSFYLDKMARHWDALVWGDYEAVMPLTWNKKWGIWYLYQPPFTASLGIFGNHLSEEITQDFLRAIPSKFRLIEIELNTGNTPGSRFPAPGSHLRTNYVLDLKKPYNELYKQYRENIRRNCKRAQQLNCRYVSGITVDEVIALSKKQMSGITNITAADYDHFKSLYELQLAKGQALACGVYTAAGELVASCVYFFSHRRAYYILVGNHPNSKTMGASHFLIDRFIHDYAGSDLLLDFEGSDLRNLAFFYSSFGATNEPYPSLRINRLPWWVRFFK